MNVFVKVFSFAAIFVLLFLAWPDFADNFDYDCSSTSAASLAIGGECPVTTQADYTNFKLAGGWRWAQNNFCVKDGSLMLFSDMCQSTTLDEARSLRFAFLGSALITSAIGLVVFRKSISSKLKKTTI